MVVVCVTTRLAARLHCCEAVMTVRRGMRSAGCATRDVAVHWRRHRARRLEASQPPSLPGLILDQPLKLALTIESRSRLAEYVGGAAVWMVAMRNDKSTIEWSELVGSSTAAGSELGSNFYGNDGAVSCRSNQQISVTPTTTTGFERALVAGGSRSSDKFNQSMRGAISNWHD